MIEYLCLWSILYFCLPLLSLVLPRCKFPLHAALLGCVVINNYLTVHPTGPLVDKFNKVKQLLEKMACQCVSELYDDSVIRTEFLMLIKVECFGGCSAFQLALESNSLDFLCLHPCQQLLSKIWYQNTSYKNSIIKIAAASWLPTCLNKCFIWYAEDVEVLDFSVVSENRKTSPSWDLVAKKLLQWEGVGLRTSLAGDNHDVACPYQNFSNQLIRHSFLMGLMIYFFFLIA